MKNLNLLKKSAYKLIIQNYAVIFLVIAIIAIYPVYRYYHRIDLKSVTLEFIPCNNMDSRIFRQIADNTGKYYGITYKIAEKPIMLPSDAYNVSAKQYDAEKVLDTIHRIPLENGVHRLLITKSDLTYGSMNFVFGLGDLPGTSAVMSFARLKTKNADNKLLVERGTKIAVHELGHTIGFKHCSNEKCVMFLSLTVLSLDESGMEYCDSCKKHLK